MALSTCTHVGRSFDPGHLTGVLTENELWYIIKSYLMFQDNNHKNGRKIQGTGTFSEYSMNIRITS